MMFWQNQFTNFKLSKKFTILLSIAFIVGIALSGSALAGVLNYNAQKQIRTEAEVLMKAMNSVRMYTNNQITPELSEQWETKFLPQSIPSYAVREVFERLREDDSWDTFFYKDATLNPTNLRDKADKFETEIIMHLQDNPDLPQLSGVRSSPTGNLYYLARPFAITDPTCLVCHDTPERAPKPMLDLYGPDNGFGWVLNKVIGIQVIYVPETQVMQRARQSFVLVIGIVIVVFAAAILLVNMWLNGFVVKPLNRITNVAEAVSTGDMEVEFEGKSQDEIGTLAQAFNRMKTSLALAMQRLERYRNSQ